MGEEAPELSTERFQEYEYFEPLDTAGVAEAQAQSAAFQAGAITNPSPTYPKLNTEALEAHHQAFTDAIASTEDEAERARLRARQRGVEIAQASSRLQDARSHEERWHAGNEIHLKSEARYGTLDAQLFWPVLAKQQAIVGNFVPGNSHAALIQERTKAMLPELPQDVQVREIVPQELLDAIRPGIVEQLEPILSAVPREGSYTSDEITAMAWTAIENCGLEQEGWVVVQNPNTRLFSVRNKKKEIVIPNPPEHDGVTFTKEAGDIARLFGHEIGVHASRKVSIGVEFEEGVGLLVESVITNSTDGAAIQRAEGRYLSSGLAEGIDGTPRNARQVLEITWRIEAMRLAKDGIITPEIEAAAKASAEAHIANNFRGTDYKLPGVYYNKAKIYLENFHKAVSYAEEHTHEPGWFKRLLTSGR